MSTTTMEERTVWADLVTVGRIAKPQGRRGEVAVNPLTDFPERFVDLGRVYIEGDDGDAVSYEVEEARLHKGRPVVKLASIATIGDASALAGKELRIPEDELRELPEGSFYHFAIQGSRVVDRSRGVLGVAEDVLSTGGTDVLVIRTPDGDELLLPFCEEICCRVDTDARSIEVDVPEGLMEINAH